MSLLRSTLHPMHRPPIRLFDPIPFKIRQSQIPLCHRVSRLRGTLVELGGFDVVRPQAKTFVIAETKIPDGANIAILR